MAKYILKRLLLLIPVTLAVAVVIFTLMYFVPGDPAKTILGSEATEVELENCRESLGLNQPYLVRLSKYLCDTFLHLDFGTSYVTGVDITTELARRLPRTLTVGSISFLLTVLIGVPLGMIAAVNQNRIGDRVSMIGALIGVSIPQFWLGLLLVLLFSVKLNWLPSSGFGTPLHYVLPCAACCVSGVANNARQARSAMLEVIRSDYITTAYAKGISRRKVIFRHALPNALIPILTSCGAGLGHIFAGSVVIETIFDIPGVGVYMLTGLNARDYPIVQSCVVVLAVLFAAVMLLVDLSYALVDPKIKAKYINSAAKKG